MKPPPLLPTIPPHIVPGERRTHFDALLGIRDVTAAQSGIVPPLSGSGTDYFGGDGAYHPLPSPIGDVDGGHADSIYGGTTPVDGGGA